MHRPSVDCFDVGATPSTPFPTPGPCPIDDPLHLTSNESASAAGATISEASALAKRYVREAGTEDVHRWTRASRVVTSRMTFVEVTSTAARKRRKGEVSAARLDRMVDSLRADTAWIEIVEFTQAVEVRARTLLGVHPLRAVDAIHLASCLLFAQDLSRRVEFVCFDVPLAAAARAEGLTVLGAP